MHLVVAPDKFAGTLTASDAARAIGRGWTKARPGDRVDLAPMSDGGPGFVSTLHAALGGAWREVPTSGAHDESVVARLLVVEDTAYIEAAQVCGQRPARSDLRPLEASSAGLATVLLAALDLGVSQVVVGVGGTVSTDGGRPVVEALGRAWPRDVQLVAAVDVERPLLGPRGAARTFGPQKGATAEQVEVLERRLAAWAARVSVDPNSAGAGAGGGLGFGLIALGASAESGSALVAEAIGLSRRMSLADLVVTGEGRLDPSSWDGKVVGRVAELAGTGRTTGSGPPCWAFVGECRVSTDESARHGIAAVWSLADTVGAVTARSDAGAALELVAIAAAGTSLGA
ncbi:MAG: glycerate kinase, partial [Actinomycetes bacterium]